MTTVPSQEIEHLKADAGQIGLGTRIALRIAFVLCLLGAAFMAYCAATGFRIEEVIR